MVLLIGLAPAVFYGQILKGAPSITNDAPTAGPVAIIFILAALMGIPILRRIGLTRRELLAIYAIVLTAGPLLSPHGLYFSLPKIILYYHTARLNPLWETTFLHLIPPWWSPSHQAVIEGFIFGEAPMPWGAWAIPLLAWSSFLVALFGACFCLLIILRKQWITHERLAFPLAQIPLETVRESTSSPVARVPHARLFWVGLGLAFAVTFWNGLANLIPALPAIPISYTRLMAWQRTGPLAGIGEIILNLPPSVVGVVYLIPIELSFSVWFFWVLRLVANCVSIAFGATAQMPESWGGTFPDPYNVGTGAVIAFGFWSLWIGRRHLLRAAAIAFSRSSGRTDAEEALPYRYAFLGLLLCFSWLIAFAMLSGSRFAFSAGLAALLVGSYTVYARVQAETALEPVEADLISWVTGPLGTRILRPAEVVTLMSMRWATFPVPSMIFPATVLNALHSLKIADAGRLNVRRLAPVLFLAFLVSLAAGIFFFMRGTYQVGYYGTAVGAAPWWPSLQSRMEGGVISEAINTPHGPDMGALGHIGGGALFCLLLGMMRLRFLWWPFHPVGFIVAMGWGIPWRFFPFFGAWLAKVLVVRYGGLRLYRQTVPIAIGLIVGDLLNSVVWAIVSALTRA